MIKQQTTKSKKLACLFTGLALSALSLPASAELKLLDDVSMSSVTGQAGLTIDIETELHIAEFEYVDGPDKGQGGSMFWKDLSLTGIGGGLVDNIRAKVDLSNPNETLATGFSDYAFAAEQLGYLDENDAEVAWAINEYSDGNGGYGKQYGDGDLVIHVSSTDMGGIDFSNLNNPAEFSQNLDNMKNAIDLHIQNGNFGLRSSDGSVETVLNKSWSAEVYLGYLDIVITNRGNGESLTSETEEGQPKGIYLGDSYIYQDAKFRVEDLDIEQTENATNTFVPRAVTNPYFNIRDMRIHNERGEDTEGSLGFASVESKTGAAAGIIAGYNDPANFSKNVRGAAIYDINVVWDWDIGHISFGDADVSIGKAYLTDFHISNTSLVISAH